jgi:DHA1 family tetracycline resistance protein-like MFS transporter
VEYRKERITIFIILVTEVLGFSLILPFLPYLAGDFGASTFTIGLISTTFSFFQFFSAPIMGALSDVYGRKPMLILSQLSTLISFVILGFANSLGLIFISRIVDGLLGSNFTIAKAYLSDITAKKDRSKSFGMTGVAFALGFLIGPAVGGFLSTQFNYQLPSFIAAGVSLLTILLTAFILPETVDNEKEKEFKLKIIDLKKFKKYFDQPIVARKLKQFLLYILSHTILISSFALFVQQKFDLIPQQIGYFFTYIGLINIIFRGIVLGKLVDNFSEKRLQKIALLSIVIGMLGAALSPNAIVFGLVMTFFAFGGGLFRPLITGAISRSVSNQEQGAVMGITDSLGSVAQIFGPLIGGIVLQTTSPVVLGLLAAGLSALAFIYNNHTNAKSAALHDN